MIEHGAEGEHVRARVDIEPVELLRRHVGRRAERAPGARVVALVGERAPDGVGEGERRHDPGLVVVPGRRAPGRLAHVLRQAPVHHHGLAELADQDVGRLQVAMDDPAVVRIGDGVRQGEHVPHQLQALAERGPRHDGVVGTRLEGLHVEGRELRDADLLRIEVGRDQSGNLGRTAPALRSLNRPVWCATPS